VKDKLRVGGVETPDDLLSWGGRKKFVAATRRDLTGD
jgi:hypothetical protein